MIIYCIANVQFLSDSAHISKKERRVTWYFNVWRLLVHTLIFYDLGVTSRLGLFISSGSGSLLFRMWSLLAFTSVSHKLLQYPEAGESGAALSPKFAKRICRKTGLNEFMLVFSPGKINLTWFQPLSPLSDSWRSILPLGWPPDTRQHFP